MLSSNELNKLLADNPDEILSVDVLLICDGIETTLRPDDVDIIDNYYGQMTLLVFRDEKRDQIETKLKNSESVGCFVVVGYMNEYSTLTFDILTIENHAETLVKYEVMKSFVDDDEIEFRRLLSLGHRYVPLSIKIN